MADALEKLPADQVAAFYRRLADAVDKNRGDLEVSLAALLMRHWLDNRDPASTFVFDAPKHLQTNSKVAEALQYHRAVYLTEQKARVSGSAERWAGLVPRLQGKAPHQRWDGQGTLAMDYQSLVELPVLQVQGWGSDAERDILYALHGFQLKTYVTVAVSKIQGKSYLRVLFQRFAAEARDRYDWDYSEHLTVPNPDYRSTASGAVSPENQTVRVYHKHAKRIEDAKLAAPYDLQTKPWSVVDARVSGAGQVDPKKSI